MDMDIGQAGSTSFIIIIIIIIMSFTANIDNENVMVAK